MKRGLVYVLAGTLVMAGMFVAYTQLLRGSREVAADLKTISADTGDVMSSASYQRFAARRKAVAAMRGMLLRVAAAESAFVADSGRPTAYFWRGHYGFSNAPGTLVYISLQGDRWMAQARSNYSSMSCSLTAMLDTSSSQLRYHPAEPVCADST